MKTIMSILVLIMLSTSANAGTMVEDKINAVNTWFANEKATTIEFQQVQWQEGKDQIANTILKFKKMFNWSN